MFYVLSFFILCAFNGNHFKLIKTIRQPGDYITTDNLGNLYIIKQNEIIKYNQSGDYFSRYSNKQLGSISYVDVTNPLKIVVLYRDFSQVLFLDNMLAETSSKIRLQDIQLEQTTLAGSSYNNGVWLYNLINFELRRLDQDFNQTHQVLNINQIVGYDINPNYLLENGSFVYLNNPETGILVFDIFGSYYKTIPIKGLSSFQVKENVLYYFKDNKLKSHEVKFAEEHNFYLPDTAFVQNIRIEKDKFFVHKKDSVSIFQSL